MTKEVFEDFLTKNLLEYARTLKIEESAKTWKIENGKFSINDSEAKDVLAFMNKYIGLGYSMSDFSLKFGHSSNNTFSYNISCNNGQECYSWKNIIDLTHDSFLTKKELAASKKQLEEYFARSVTDNRSKLLGNEANCRKFLVDGLFYRNNLEKMIDKETHDYVLDVKNLIKKECQDAIEAAEKRIRDWGLGNGSELLKARIAGGFEFKNLAIKEYQRHITPAGYCFVDFIIYSYKRPSLEEINALGAEKVLFQEKGSLRLVCDCDDWVAVELEMLGIDGDPFQVYKKI